jgi:hypothetical protein
LKVRPGHFSAAEYYRAPVDNLRSYPYYAPGREPEGYWKMLNSIGPKPLIEPEKLKTEADWIAAGKRVFEEYDVPGLSRDRSSEECRRACARSDREVQDRTAAGWDGRGFSMGGRTAGCPICGGQLRGVSTRSIAATVP